MSRLRFESSPTESRRVHLALSVCVRMAGSPRPAPKVVWRFFYYLIFFLMKSLLSKRGKVFCNQKYRDVQPGVSDLQLLKTVIYVQISIR